MASASPRYNVAHLVNIIHFANRLVQATLPCRCNLIHRPLSQIVPHSFCSQMTMAVPMMATSSFNTYTRASSPVTIRRHNWVCSSAAGLGSPGPNFGATSPRLGCSPTIPFDCSQMIEELLYLTSPRGSPHLGSSPLHSVFEHSSIRRTEKAKKKRLKASILRSDQTNFEPKKVSFADETGSRLVHIKEYQPDHDSQMNFLQITSGSERCPSRTYSRLNWVLKFVQPSHDYDLFFNRLAHDNVCLETAFIDGLRVLGFVRVKNVSFEKRVSLRLTYNDWETHEDVMCEFYSPQVSGRQNFDKFQFCFPLSIASNKDVKIQFAIYFKSDAGEFWDNNFGQNYSLGVKEIAATSTSK